MGTIVSETGNEQVSTLQSAIAQSKVIRAIVVESGSLRQVPDLLRAHFDTPGVFLVADENTMAAAGQALAQCLSERGVAVATHVFPGSPRLKGKVENAEVLVPLIRENGGVPVAVGSGVINDLVKCAAFQAGVPYATVATAASMDGYASAGSPLVRDGFKHTIACAAPRVVVADLDVVAAAPKEMASWGYGDLAGKLPAGADWLIADALGIEALDDSAWPMVQGNLRSWLAHPSRLARGDAEATGALFTGLVLVGVAMEVHGSSRPASGADHQIAHLWEMDGLEIAGLPVSHGTCVAIGTLTALSLYERLLARDLGDLDAGDVIARRPRLADLEAEIDRRFPNPAIAERAMQETRAKFIEDGGLRGRIDTIRRTWPDLKRRLAAQLPSFDTMRAMLADAGLPTDPSDIGIDGAYHRETVIASRLIRRRYTVLDLLEDSGLFDRAVDEIFSAGGRWA